MHQKEAGRIENRVDPDQTGLVCTVSCYLELNTLGQKVYFKSAESVLDSLNKKYFCTIP